ncbi:TraB/GumN family protein [Sphingomicrobium astaxanthinifaciens]|uniref:TraB/GumN family protein n=1 Tax=Sphingomicrobium astaxanthinifaciens TaxID=1227949 RepID=UPI001FCA8E15|nr:TraB/GumN family protein [Sphingomicrobium astaxanthinifaciens]MCJ7422059.1 TraB/GumN family protein [Sphingomicrobium astaxanthinifaciens]
MKMRIQTLAGTALAALSLAAAPALADDHAVAAANADAAAADALVAVDADPALWVVEDEDTTIYLFGTFHAMKPGVDWFNDEVRTSYDAADEVVVELVPPTDPAEMQPIIMQYAVDRSGTPLSAKLSAQARTELHATLAEMGAPAQAFDMFKPGFASAALTAGLMPKMGFEEGLGVDKAIITAANADGKPITELETMEEQLALFTVKIDEAEQIRLLEEMLLELDEMDDTLETMLAAWKSGDEAVFAELFAEMNDSSAAFYEALLTERNADWAEWIDARMDAPGTVFVAVGAGHLMGADSVQRFLTDKGIASRRVN